MRVQRQDVQIRPQLSRMVNAHRFIHRDVSFIIEHCQEEVGIRAAFGGDAEQAPGGHPANEGTWPALPSHRSSETASPQTDRCPSPHERVRYG